jgi:hypothetical protein
VLINYCLANINRDTYNKHSISKKIVTKLELNKGSHVMEGFRELHNNSVSKIHDSKNNTPLNIV